MLGLLLAEPALEEVEQLLRAGDSAIMATSLAEVVDRLIRRRGVTPAEVQERLGPLVDEVLTVLPIEKSVGWHAGELRARHYQRSDAALSLADCVLLATAVADRHSIATSDHALAQAAHSSEIEVIPLPASDGSRPSVG
jgi:PIN domain nuclease of toxin-antitoxin system